MRTCERPGCTHPVFGGGYCRIHQYLRGDKEKKKIGPYSKKRQKDNRKYSELRKGFLEDKICEFPGCERQATDIHHARGRGAFLLDVSTWKALCREHHTHCETHPDEAKSLGLSNSRLAKLYR